MDKLEECIDNAINATVHVDFEEDEIKAIATAVKAYFREKIMSLPTSPVYFTGEETEESVCMEKQELADAILGEEGK